MVVRIFVASTVRSRPDVLKPFRRKYLVLNMNSTCKKNSVPIRIVVYGRRVLRVLFLFKNKNRILVYSYISYKTSSDLICGMINYPLMGICLPSIRLCSMGQDPTTTIGLLVHSQCVCIISSSECSDQMSSERAIDYSSSSRNNASSKIEGKGIP